MESSKHAPQCIFLFKDANVRFDESQDSNESKAPMSRHLTNQQHKTRLIAVFLFTVLLALTFYVYKGRMQPAASLAASNASALDDSLFMGLRHAIPAEIQAALPDAVGKATLIDFSSRLCHDCQRLAPVLSNMMPKHPHIYFKRIDVLDEQQQYPAALRAFKPVSVPVLVFIDPRGEIRNVLYNYQPPQTIAAALTALETQSAPTHSAKKK
jgi:thiol:disulfide interchange protein